MLPLLALLVATPAFAQGGGTAASLIGSVADPAGGVIPGATVEVKNNATGVTERLVTNSSGVFSVPSLNPGTYTVSVSLSGFKTHVLNEVRIIAATANEVKVTLQLGSAHRDGRSRRRSTDLVRTQATTVQNTMTTEQITKLPLVSRNALSAVMFLPGRRADRRLSGRDDQRTAAEHHQHHARRHRHRQQPAVGRRLLHAGVPAHGRDRGSHGHWRDARRRQRRAGVGADRVRRPARAATAYDASIYHYYRTPTLNTNYYFNEINNLPKNAITVHQYGGRVGGPIKPRQGVLLLQLRAVPPAERGDAHPHDPAAAGACSGAVPLRRRRRRSTRCNVLELAARSGQLAVDRSDDRPAADVDPRARPSTTGTILTTTNLNTQSYTFQPPSVRNEYAPTTRVDVNLTSRHRLTGTYLVAAHQERPGLPEHRRAAVPGLPELQLAVLLPDHRVGQPAVDAQLEHGQRAEDRLPVDAGGLLQRQAGERVRQPGRPRHHARLRPDQRDERQRAEPAQHAEHQHRRVAQLAARAVTASGSAARYTTITNKSETVELGADGGARLHVGRTIRPRACSPRRTSRARRRRS